MRDDFWLATSRFMQPPEVELLEGKNLRLVDLLDPLHARKVLPDFGQAYGRLSDQVAALATEFKGGLRWYDKVLEASGYGRRPLDMLQTGEAR